MPVISAWQWAQAWTLYSSSNFRQTMTVQENVAMMGEYMDLSRFRAIYVVDLCGSLCKQVRADVGPIVPWHSSHPVVTPAANLIC